MKYLLAVLLFTSIAQAQTYTFTFKIKGDTLSYKTDARTWDKAFENAAIFCINYIQIHYDQFTPDEIIDICVNPKEKK